MKHLIVNIGHADIEKTEKEANAKLKNMENIILFKTLSNGHNTQVLFAAGDNSLWGTLQIRIVEIPINDPEAAAKIIDKATEDISVVDILTTTDINRIIVIYEAE